MRVVRVLCLSALLLASASGCFRSRGADTDPEPPTIEVRNRYFGAVVVYVVSSGNAQRLGMVQSNRTEKFDFPVGVNPFGPDLRLSADPIGELETYTSETIALSGGDIVVLTVENALRLSNVYVR